MFLQLFTHSQHDAPVKPPAPYIIILQYVYGGTIINVFEVERAPAVPAPLLIDSDLPRQNVFCVACVFRLELQQNLFSTLTYIVCECPLHTRTLSFE